MANLKRLDRDQPAVDRDQQILLRLRQLLKDHPQAEIARRLGLARSTVNAYFKGSRIPASFLGGLVDAFKLNPAWLLCGEGTQWLADVSEGAARMAGDMLEVVQAMNSVAQMRLGALLGRDHLNTLRELNTKITGYDTLHKRLGTASEPVLLELVARLGKNAGAQHPKELLETVAAGEQISRFVSNPELVLEFDRLRAWHMYRGNRLDESLAVMRSVLFRALLSGKPLTREFAAQAHDYTFFLTNRWRMREARRIARAVLTLLDNEGNDWPGTQDLILKVATLDVELGDLESGLNGLRAHLAETNGEYRTAAHRWSSHWILLCAGLASVEETIRLCDGSFSWLNMSVRLMGIVDSPQLLEKTIEVHRGIQSDSLPGYIDMLGRRLERWRRALKDKDPSAADEARKDSMPDANPDPALESSRQFARAAEATRLARCAEDWKGAARHLRDAERERSATPGEVTHGLHLLAEHYRNVLEIANHGQTPDAELVAEATGFFRHHRARGYLLFAEIGSRRAD